MEHDMLSEEEIDTLLRALAEDGVVFANTNRASEKLKLADKIRGFKKNMSERDIGWNEAMEYIAEQIEEKVKQ